MTLENTLSSNGFKKEIKDLEAKVDYVSQLSDVDKAKVDYTSQLLDDVLSSILSRITIKDAVKTSILSTRVRFYFSYVPVSEHVKISLRGDASMPYIFGEFAANLPAQVKSLIVTAWNTQGSGMMAEDNSNELASLITSVKNDSMAEDNTDELVSPVTCVKNDSMDEDNIDELVSPVTSVKSDFAGSKPDKISTIKLRSMSNGNKVLPYYRSSSSTSSYNAGNTRWQYTGTLNAPDSGQDIIPHYLRAFTGSCHDFVNMESVLKDEKKVTVVEQKPSSPPGCMEGGIDEVIIVEQKSSASLVSMLGEGENVTVVEEKLSNPLGSMLVEGKKEAMFKRGNIVDLQQETSSPRRLTVRWGRHVGESQDNNTRKRIFKKKGVDGDKSNTIPISGKIVLRHLDMQEKKDVQGLLNNVIEETTSKLVETGKSKVKALVGAFETLVSLHNKPYAITVS
ncbi:hypothetical protein CQW23_32725 [Capsicum baccatum]|uniref:Calmodulin-binding domain-containing protein n=1 Tax=Capsicum baccatum TaxID=33114 RepID=A0A2G2V3X4_CAPBA|nr:hypothetical protein CQW23_32725 [Capsicum baccatum]